MRVAVAGFGDAGSSIAKKIRNFDVYTVLSYDFNSINNLLRDLSEYDFIILIAGLGGNGANALIEVSHKIKNKMIYLVKPLSVEKTRVEKAKKQINSLEKFILFELDKFASDEKYWKMTIHDFLDTIDNLIAKKIESDILNLLTNNNSDNIQKS